MTIGITDCEHYDHYREWFAQEDINIIRLSHRDGNADAIQQCGGVVLTGGGDVHPKYYNGSDAYRALCEEIDEGRDAFEWRVLDYTEKSLLPVLGICRGLQVVNVYLGGTLLPHIPAFGKFNHAQLGAADRYHTIQVDPHSLMHTIAGTSVGMVNSAHHQAADRIGTGLTTNALSPDGVVEGLERPAGKGKGFILLVQWHPERMKDQDSPFSKNIRTGFLKVVSGNGR